MPCFARRPGSSGMNGRVSFCTDDHTGYACMDMDLIEGGFNLLLYGMGTVFVFLGILVMITQGMSKVVSRFAPEEPLSTPTAPVARAVSGRSVDPATLKVLQAAVDRHRGRT